MTQTLTRRLSVGFAALLVAGVLGGVTALSLVGGSQQPAQQQPVTVSDEASETPAADPTPTAEATTASPTATAAPVTTKPAAKSTTGGTKSSGSTTNSGSKQMTEQTEPEPAPTVPQNNPGDVLPPAPKRCTDERGLEIPCPRD